MNYKRLGTITALAGLILTATACGDDDNVASEPTTVVTAESSSATADCAEEPTEEAAEALLVGLTEQEATDAAEACGWTLRVLRRDGEDLPATLDLRPDRVNVEVTGDEVTAIVSVG